MFVHIGTYKDIILPGNCRCSLLVFRVINFRLEVNNFFISSNIFPTPFLIHLAKT